MTIKSEDKLRGREGAIRIHNSLVSSPESAAELLTAPEIAETLRCSKAQVYRLISGRVKGVSKLPAISLGRKKIVRRSSLDAWLETNERAMLHAQLETNAVGCMDLKG